ncbi:SPFH domain-containing protein [Cellulomonas sp. HZM]|uniref:SPFH domain-containing protein n=1 Tax=Cellulomonas sp. HZM TaxID=1454010 RepID=UPI000493926A|nr:SPFH domain-containing protein [Cellulomonas sp. HZM]
MRIVVQEWEKVLVYKDGRFEVELAPGRFRLARRRRRFVHVVVRPRVLTVPVQEVLTADGLSVKVSLTGVLRVADARAWTEAVQTPDAFVYAELQVALRDEVAARTLEELLAQRVQVADALLAATAQFVASVGAVLERLAVRDVVVPAELRRAAADAATARLEGLVALERARTEVAATRALANAARLVGTTPGLLELRTLQAVEAGGATVVLKQGVASA